MWKTANQRELHKTGAPLHKYHKLFGIGRARTGRCMIQMAQNAQIYTPIHTVWSVDVAMKAKGSYKYNKIQQENLHMGNPRELRSENCFKRSVSQVHSPFPTLCFHSVQTRIGRATFPRVWITQTNFCCCGFFWWVSLSTSKLNGVVGIVSVTRMPVVWWERLTFASCGCGNLFGNCKANSGFIVHADVHLARFLAEHLGNGIIWLGDALLCFWSNDRNLTRHFSRKNIVEQQLRSHFHGNPSN